MPDDPPQDGAKTSDISGKEVPEGTGGTVRLVYADPARDPDELLLTAGEVRQLLSWADVTPREIVLKHGRRSDISGKVIAPESGATLQMRYFDRAGKAERLDVNINDDEVARLTGRNLTWRRVQLALTLAFCGTVAVLVIAGLVNGGLLVRHPVFMLAGISAVTIFVATLSWKVFERVSSRVVVLASGITALVTAFLAIVPNIGPGTEESGAIGKISVEQGIPLADYYNDPEVRYLFRDCVKTTCPVRTLIRAYCASVRRLTPQRSCSAASANSVVLYIPVESVGYVGKKLAVRWRLFRAGTNTPLADQPVNPLGDLNVTPTTRDADSLTFPVWINTEAIKAKKVYLRVYLSDDRHVMIAAATSPTFTTST